MKAALAPLAAKGLLPAEFPVVRDGRVVAKLVFDGHRSGTIELCADFAK